MTSYAKYEPTHFKTENKPAIHQGLVLADAQCLLQALSFYFTFVPADSLMLRHVRHRQALNREPVK